jgi:phosphatidylglycerol---prolipoprotein diacylglyceryl transferase
MFPLIRLTPSFGLPTYLLIISLTYCLCIYLVYKRSEKSNLAVSLSLDVCLAIMIGGFLGARLFHVFYEEPKYYIAHPIRILEFWQGGFVYFGGLIGAVIAAFLFLHHKKESFLKWADFFAPVLSLGYALGRLACFLNGCCYGRICSLPWAVTFHEAGLPTGPRHPTQLYATFWELGVFVTLLTLEKRKQKNIFVLWLMLHSAGRIIMEYFRDDDRGPLLAGFSIATWISVVFIILGATKLILSQKNFLVKSL